VPLLLLPLLQPSPNPQKPTTASHQLPGEGGGDCPIDFVIITDDIFMKASPGPSEDFLLAQSLKALGYYVERRSYQDESFDWSSTKVAIIRSAWGRLSTEDRLIKFNRFHQETSLETTVLNYEVDKWVQNKPGYTRDLARMGINTLDFVYVAPNHKTSLAGIQSSKGWDGMVFKPATHSAVIKKVTAENIEEMELIWQEYSSTAMIVQEFQRRITEGERSIIFIGGKISHAILKIPKKGGFDVHEEAGGTSRLYEPSDEEVSFAEAAHAALGRLGHFPVFARIDIVRDNINSLALMELTVESAELSFWFKPSAAEHLAAALHDGFIDCNFDKAELRSRDPGYPNSQFVFEDEEWERLPQQVKAAAINLGYTAATWNDGDKSLDIEGEDWGDLSSEQRHLLSILGYSEAMWDPCNDAKNIVGT
jgi:hypothetical protein